MEYFITALAFLVIFSILVLIHEWGHFFAARRAGVKVEEFGFGLPPRVWGKKKGETIYSLNWIPFGGFVKLYGEDANDDKLRKNSRSYSARPAGTRMLIVCAGVLMNLLLCWFLLTVGFTIGIQPLILEPDQFFEGVENGSIITEPGLVVQDVRPGTLAEEAGLQPGDALVSLNGVEIVDPIQLTAEEVGDFVIERDGETMTMSFTPRDVVLYQASYIPRPSVYETPEAKDAVSVVEEPIEKSMGSLLPGDVITAVNDQPVYYLDEMESLLEPGDNSFTVLRDDATVTLSTTLDAPALHADAVVLGAVFPETPAESAGLQAHDQVLAINNEALENPNDLVAFNQNNPGEALVYQVQRGEETLDLSVTPDEGGRVGVNVYQLSRVDGLEYPLYEGVYTASVVAVEDVRYPVWIAPWKAVEETGKLAVLTVQMFGQVVRQLVTSFTVPDGVAGPVGIAQMTFTVVQEGFGSLLRFMALLSLSLAIINIFPFPALDGGRAFFILVEVIFKKRLKGRAEALVHLTGFVFLMALIVAVTYSDIVRWISSL